MVIYHSYVSLPEGKLKPHQIPSSVATGLSHVRCFGSGQLEHFGGNASAVAGRGSVEARQLGFFPKKGGKLI